MQWPPSIGSFVGTPIGTPLNGDCDALPLLILWLVRKGAADNSDSLCELLGLEPRSTTLGNQIELTIEKMIRLRLLCEVHADDGDHMAARSRLILGKKWEDIRKALNLSLATTLAAHAPGSLVTSPLFGQPSTESKFKADIFVVMPFRPHLEVVHQQCIKSVAAELGLSVARGDDWASDHFIVSNIWSHICGARLIVADCTDCNPNVLYEVGMAHAVGKPTLILTQDTNSIPHDIRYLRHLCYESSPAGLARLENDLKQAILSTIAP